MDIIHFGAVRLRVIGTGNLQLRLLSLNETNEKVLTPVVMSLTTDKYPNVLANFSKQRAQLEIKTTEIDEVFEIGEVIIYTKPIFASYPQ